MAQSLGGLYSDLIVKRSRELQQRVDWKRFTAIVRYAQRDDLERFVIGRHDARERKFQLARRRRVQQHQGRGLNFAVRLLLTKESLQKLRAVLFGHERPDTSNQFRRVFRR